MTTYREIEYIRVRVFVKGKDNFFAFPSTLDGAYKIIQNEPKNIRSTIKLNDSTVTTFRNSKDWIEVFYK